MADTRVFIAGCVFASVITGINMVSFGGSLSPAPGPITPTMLTLTDLAALSAPHVEGTGHNYFCTKDGIINPESIPMGGTSNGLPSYGASPDIPGSSIVGGREGQIEIDSIQEQVIAGDTGPEHQPLRLRIKRDQSMIAMLNKMKNGDSVDMVIEVEDFNSGGTLEVRERITIVRADICSITCSPDRRTYIVELKPQIVQKEYIEEDGTTHSFTHP
ncbi:MAG: hypothetical protein ACF8GE_10985 [Phycisphaerales bacterium JB043]